MNRIQILAISVLLTCNSCLEHTGSNSYTTAATIFLVNESSVVVKSDDILGYVLQPGDTLIHKESHTNDYGQRPSINNYTPFATNNSLFLYGNNSECELGLNRIENYEERKETGDLVFEFTFRFTDEKRTRAEPCNLKN